jgi:GTPase
LYEIGVADDGTFVGLVDDEMNESLQNLKAMAASLGCVVNVLRRVSVGTCEFLESMAGTERDLLRKEKLWVVEAYVKPSIATSAPKTTEEGTPMHLLIDDFSTPDTPLPPTQLKVSLTGATMSGKSTLLGSLTTGTLDNGRGKSRLNLLKHRHEIVSGMTSSVTQELLGYTEKSAETVEVVNYASNNVSSWTDIHSACMNGRIVLLSDSAGHPRYRRTTLRGIIGWSPDWTLLCIPADNAEDTSGLLGSTPPAEEVLGVSSVDVDLSQAHLELCLKLELRLIIVITKLDLASKAGLRQLLAKALSTLKAAGRTPVILANPSSAGEDLLTIPASVYAACGETASSLNDPRVVPIILTSTVKGTNITTLHALLCQLPVSSPGVFLNQHDPATLFYIEDTYTARSYSGHQRELPVLSGNLARGQLSIGDQLWLGPFTFDILYEQRQPRSATDSGRPAIPTSRSFPGALKNAQVLPCGITTNEDEWIKVRVTSLRHLRLPVPQLLAGQVGTVGTCLIDTRTLPPAVTRIRKGMVLAEGPPEARRGFVAEFVRKDVDSLSIGMSVVVYVASVRASAKVIAGAVPDDAGMESSVESLKLIGKDEEDGFAFSFDAEAEATPKTTSDKEDKIARLLVTFQFIATTEYLDAGSQVLVMPGGGPGLYGGNERGEKGIAGLEGFVGTITSVY